MRSSYSFTMQASAGMTLLLVLGCLCLVPSTDAEESPQATRELQAQVRLLLVELDSNQRAKRQAAEKSLLDFGPRILSELPPPELLPNQAVRATVSRVRVVLERRQAQESVQPSRLTIPKDVALSDWLKQVESQSGNQLDASALSSEILQSRVDRECQGEAFWPAVEGLLQEKKLRFRFAADSSVLRLVPESAAEADRPWSAAMSGPFRVAVNEVKPRKVTGNDQVQRLRTDLAVAPEPRLRALFLKLAAKDFRATGPQGMVFPAADAAAQFDLPLGEGGRYVRWNLDFSAPSGLSAAEIFPLKIQGRAAMQIAAGSEHIRFTDLVGGEGTARRRGGVTVTVQKIKSRKLEDGTQSLSVKVLVVYDTGGPAFESHRTWIFHNEVYLDRSEGAALPLNGAFETDLQANGSVGVTYRFDGLKGPLSDYQFVYVAPTLIVDVPFEIELKGIRPPEAK